MLGNGHTPDLGASCRRAVRTAAVIADNRGVTDAVALDVSMPGIGRGWAAMTQERSPRLECAD
jgi:hypothetical protein